MIDAQGTRLHTVELGEGGRLTVMLHGLLLGNLATWYFTVAPALASTGRVRLFDLRGHGRSDRPAVGYDLATMAGDLEAVLGQDREPVDLVGHSYGALIALTYALSNPRRVRRLVLVEAPMPPTDPSEIVRFLYRPAEEMVEALPPGVQRAVAGGRRQARRLVEHLVGLAQDTSVLDDLAAMPGFSDEELAELDLPVLCVYGDASGCLEGGEALAAALRRGRLEVLPGGHYLHLDAASALTETIQGFLDG